jgi:MFS family permease
MDLSLFSIRSFSVPLAATSLTFAALSGSLLFLAFYFQVVRGWSPLQSGALTVPFAIGQLLSAPRSGKMVARFGARRVIPFGLILASSAMFGFTRLDLTTPVWLLVLIPFVFGFGMGNVVAPSTTRMTLATPPQRSGAGSAVQNTVRQVGATLGVAVISSVVATKYSGSMSSALEGSPLPADLQVKASDSVGATYEVAATLQASGRATAEQADMLRSAADAAFIPAFQIAAYMGLALLLTALVIILVWLPAQAEAVAWKAGGTSAAPPGQPGAGAAGEAADDPYATGADLDAAHQVHVVAEDPEHLSHVEDAPLEHPLGESAPERP